MRATRSRNPIGTALRVLAATALASWWVLLPAAPASASSLTGCSGTAQSLDAGGQVIDSVEAKGGQLTDTKGGGQAFTKSNPFLVDNEGVVNYKGSSDAVITNHTWYVSMFGLKVVKGGSANASRTQTSEGQFVLKDKVPFKFTGLIRVSGDLTGSGGSCTGSGYVKVQGKPITNPVMWAGVAFAAAGGIALIFSMPRMVPTEGVPA